jgi:hypothetical protein
MENEEGQKYFATFSECFDIEVSENSGQGGKSN